MSLVEVLIADDHAPTRADMREILEADGRFSVCGEAADGPAAISAAVRTRPDICLLDVRMPGSGILAAWEITSRLPRTQVIMLTVSREDDDLFRALRSGAAGYLLKDVHPSALPELLLGALRGEAPLSPLLASKVLAAFRDGSPRRRQPGESVAGVRLTSREWEVLDLMRQGRKTTEIAASLAITPATARSHLASALRKLRLPSRAAAIAFLGDGGAGAGP
jgi:DNA-binding NarL/FixJ family response regulator